VGILGTGAPLVGGSVAHAAIHAPRVPPALVSPSFGTHSRDDSCEDRFFFCDGLLTTTQCQPVVKVVKVVQLVPVTKVVKVFVPVQVVKVVKVFVPVPVTPTPTPATPKVIIIVPPPAPSPTPTPMTSVTIPDPPMF
jgi:hypothetical protein